MNAPAQAGLAAYGSPRDLGDEEDQRTNAGLENAVGSVDSQGADQLVDFLEEHATLQHAR